MSCSLSFHIPRALPFLSPPRRCQNHSFSLSCTLRPVSTSKLQVCESTSSEAIQDSGTGKLPALAIHAGAILATVAQPAIAVTGVNDEEDLVWVLIQLGISAFLYFLVFPPIIMNWLRTRWYKRNLLEMYLQFMFVFLFFPGVLLWAPFLNFRKFPRDPSMKYPWSVPQDPSQIKGGFPKFPWAQPQDYE